MIFNINKRILRRDSISQTKNSIFIAVGCIPPQGSLNTNNLFYQRISNKKSNNIAVLACCIDKKYAE
jgi:hypothetical protein